MTLRKGVRLMSITDFIVAFALAVGHDPQIVLNLLYLLVDIIFARK